MHIEVVGDESISQQARTYAEYRVFAALSRLVDTDRVRRARLILRRTQSKRAGEGVACTVTVDIKDGDSLRVRTSGDHPYAAINRAVERLAEGGWRPRTGDHSRVAHAIAE
jgi:ribosome-associated translation inhibitor RaiA